MLPGCFGQFLVSSMDILTERVCDMSVKDEFLFTVKILNGERCNIGHVVLSSDLIKIWRAKFSVSRE